MTRRAGVSVDEYARNTWFASSTRTIPVSQQPICNGEIHAKRVSRNQQNYRRENYLLRSAARGADRAAPSPVAPLFLGLGAGQALFAPSMAAIIVLTAAPGAR